MDSVTRRAVEEKMLRRLSGVAPPMRSDPTPSLNALAIEVHRENRFRGASPGHPAVALMMVVSEIVEAMEGERRDLMDDKLPHRKQVEVELADAILRILDYAGGRGLDLDGAIREKRAFNLTRSDFDPDERSKPHGKKW